MADAEFIVVCIDNSTQAYRLRTYESQIEAVMHYCKTKLNANPETEVTIFTMGSDWFRQKQDATSDIQNILDYVQSIYRSAGLLWFHSAINHGRCGFIRCPPDKPKRMLFLVGGLVDLCEMDAKDYGLILKDMGIAVDVVNFYLEKNPRNITMDHQFGKMELDAFVAAANSNDNSHIAHVKPGSSISRALSHFFTSQSAQKKVTRKKRQRVKLDNRKTICVLFSCFNVFSAA